MENNYSRQEQEAIVSVLCALSKADFRTHNEENQCLQDCLREIGFEDDTFQPFPKGQLEHRAFDTLKNMSLPKKRAFSRMLTQISRSDGHFGPLERAFVRDILEMCVIPFVHK